MAYHMATAYNHLSSSVCSIYICCGCRHAFSFTIKATRDVHEKNTAAARSTACAPYRRIQLTLPDQLLALVLGAAAYVHIACKPGVAVPVKRVSVGAGFSVIIDIVKAVAYNMGISVMIIYNVVSALHMLVLAMSVGVTSFCVAVCGKGYRI